MPDDLNDLKKCSQTANELAHLRGVLSSYISKHADEIPPNYASILAQASTTSSLAKEISREAGKESSSFGRFFRRIIGKPSLGDNVYSVAKYFPPKPEEQPTANPPPVADAEQKDKTEPEIEPILPSSNLALR